jgi:tetratricopeptide (TPR) repeat protein
VIAILAAGLAALAAAAAPAEKGAEKTGPTTAVAALAFGDPAAARTSALVTHSLRRAIGRDPQLRLVEPSAVAGVDADPLRQGAERAEALYLEGKTAYDGLDLPLAAKKLFQAAAEFEAAPAYVQRRGAYPLALVYLGATEMMNGKAQRAKDVLKRVVSFDPALEPDPTLFAQDLRDLYAKVRDELRKVKPGTIGVSLPAGGRVSIDGVFRGVAPIDTRVLPGVHLVRIEQDGFFPFGQTVTVVPGGASKVVGSMKPAGRQKILEDFVSRVAAAGPDDVGPARELGRWLGADRVILVQVGQLESAVSLLARVIDVQSGQVLASQDQRGLPSDDDALVKATDPLAAQLLAAKPAPPKATPKANPQIVPQCASDDDCPGGSCDYQAGRCISDDQLRPPIYKRWYFWAGVGALAVVGAGVAIYAATRTEPDQPAAVVFHF